MEAAQWACVVVIMKVGPCAELKNVTEHQDGEHQMDVKRFETRHSVHLGDSSHVKHLRRRWEGPLETGACSVLRKLRITSSGAGSLIGKEKQNPGYGQGLHAQLNPPNARIPWPLHKGAPAQWSTPGRRALAHKTPGWEYLPPRHNACRGHSPLLAAWGEIGGGGICTRPYPRPLRPQRSEQTAWVGGGADAIDNKRGGERRGCKQR